MRPALTAAFVLTAFAHSICAQPDTFEAAIVRPSGPNSVFRSDLDASQFVASRHTLAMLIQSSYPEMPSWRMSGGPPWMTTDFWDFIAKLPPGTPTEPDPRDRRTEQLLRNFLADEFKLKTHFEQREQPVYELVPAKGGPKIKPSDSAQFSYRGTPGGGAEFHHATMQQLANFLYCPSCYRQAADRPVFNKTGLDGYYDFTLNWTPSNIQTDNPGPSIYTAIEEQLGLKLQSQKAPIDFLIVDHAERPSQN